MERIEVNVQTGEVTVIQFTAEEVEAALAYAASLPAFVGPTLDDLQAQLANLQAQIATFGGAAP